MEDRRNLKPWLRRIIKHCKPYWENENIEIFPRKKERRKNAK